MTALYRLIYVSSTSAERDVSFLDALLEVARRKNARADVTGLLLYHDGSFFQVLEGGREQVARIFGAIERDPRHSGLLVLQAQIVKTRAFAQWSMGFFRAHDLRPEQKSHLVDLRDFVDRIGPTALTEAPAVARQIDAFLSTFREFAAA